MASFLCPFTFGQPLVITTCGTMKYISSFHLENLKEVNKFLNSLGVCR